MTTVVAGFAVVTGLLLDIAIAASFGAGRATDAFFVASRIPIGMQAVVIAAANQVLLPNFSRLLLKGDDEIVSRLASRLVSAVLAAGGLFVLLGYLLAGPLMRITAPGLSSSQISLAATMVPIVFAVFPLVTVSEVLRALLNARFAFVAPAAMNVVYNSVAVVTILFFAHHNIRIVAWALLAGACVQVAFMFAMALRKGLRFRPSLRLRDPEVVAVGGLSVRPLLAGAANPVARLGEQVIMSFLPTGSITILSYGYRLISAIGGTIFFRSVMVALLPRLTRATQLNDVVAMRRIGNLGVRMMLALSIPLTGLMAVLATPVALVVFQRGRFTRDNAILLGLVLVAYSASLIGSGVQRALLAPFFARLDTKTPLRNTIYGVAANLVLLPLFVLPFGRTSMAVLGVPIAYSLAQYVNVAHAAYRLYRGSTRIWSGALEFSFQVIMPTGAAIGAMSVLYMALGLDQVQSRWTLLAETLLVGAVGVASLALLYSLTNRDEVNRVLRAFTRTRKPPPPQPA